MRLKPQIFIICARILYNNLNYEQDTVPQNHFSQYLHKLKNITNIQITGVGT